MNLWRWKRVAQRDTRAFGERFSWQMAALFAGMALYLVAGAILEGRQIGIAATLIVLPLTYGYRWRMAAYERRRGETMEDERDAQIRAHGDRGFRIVTSCWCCLLALVLSFDVGRAALSANDCAVPGLILLGVVIANFAGHVTVAWLYWRERQ